MPRSKIKTRRLRHRWAIKKRRRAERRKAEAKKNEAS